MEHDREDSMDDMIGGVHPSINVGQMNAATRFHHFSKMSPSSYNNTLLENDQNLLEGMMMNNNLGGGSNSKGGGGGELSFVPTMTTSSNANSPSKRTLSSLYNWNDHDDVAAQVGTSSSNKRFNLESVVRNDHQENGTVANSFASLLNNLPQTPSLHQQQQQQTMLGSIPYQIQGMNWYG